MSKTIIGVLVVMVIIVGGYFVMSKDKIKDSALTENTETVNTGAEVTTKEAEQPTGKKMAFSQFIEQDSGSYKCEVKQYMSDFENSGTVYINKGNIRGDFSTVAEGRKIDSSFIQKDNYTYNWSSEAPNMGVKVAVVTNTESNTDAQMQGTYSWDAKQIGDYTCEEWIVDESKFSIPTSVTFTEIKQ